MYTEAWEAEWERVLWKKKPYPDNYVPRSFLASLSRNPNFQPYTYRELVILSCPISQHLASIFVFLAVFMRLQQRLLDPRVLVWLSGGVFLTGYIVWELLERGSVDTVTRNTNRAKTLKASILVFLALMSLSPVLKTLTAATSSDSIWALSACLFILNALLADYTAIRPRGHKRERLTSVLSMNAAISSSVVLASRLSDDLSVFGLILFSVQSFALFPMLRRRMQDGAITLQVILTTLISVLSVILTYPLSSTAAYIYIACFIFVTLVAPGVLVWAQKYKNEIRGTWDPAVPKVNRRMSVTR
ncbi:phosphatidylinositol N-acetylglucosaminyltransferase [Dichomitus squalens]|uniref:Phosphatidylinositol N-acetylglucosaminyltransferase n=1 Tax=Dichomitus squalens TaxID=114155 RepID=A0A4Q9P241_9APHY|nr:phosphatidylinositol N-acetylglucosaminyltransferase [Dichomitus squalens LYAD-421 SS1]EJF66685.1 phosphatidylinositol N-acetylglucosaminyltransferase [Dichomitus squalens LYAD-421 SS1]TBU35231.1 phosphatidylinositol N-acetylglucosaminyltransferase [Dichomitus squalens]TBU48349.1 phosphatidylinositol N-acetylglucosaminyltransferase [Dichomitus squalens]TBU65059.1 phosphatidylinositol N-acetylglucosaminyltransferase [Dichomitus squalens]